ncbi:MAG: hypothetical protein ABIQ93_08530 [Saprospiraceae bacterium]
MLERIRFAFFKRALRRALAEGKRLRRIHTLESARTIGLLFDATAEPHRREVMTFAKELEKNGKKMRLLGYIKTKQPPGQQPFDFFFQKETTWTGQPKSEKANAFIREKFDLLICLDPADERPLEWLCLVSPAAMKIGLATQRPHDLDMQLEIPANKGYAYFAEQLHLYLDKIVLTTNEPARAI